MPSPNVVNKRKSLGKATTGAEAGSSPLGIYDTNSVRARIDKWQTVNNSLAQPIDGRENNQPLSPVRKPPNKHAQPFATQVRSPPQHDTANEKDAELSAKAAGRPRRRLVSDEHWKSPGKEQPIAEQKNKSKILQPSQGKPNAWVRPKPQSSPTKDKTPDRTGKSPKKENVEPRSGRAQNESKVSGASSGTVKAMADPEDQDADLDSFGGALNAQNLKIMASGKKAGSPAAQEKAKPYHPALQYFAGRPIPDAPPEPPAASPPKKPSGFRPALQYFAGKPAPRLSKPSEDGPKKPKAPAADSAPRVSEKKSAFEDVAPPALGRIEAWLGAASDPFVEHKTSRNCQDSQEDPGSRSREAEVDEDRRRRRERRRAQRTTANNDEAPPTHGREDATQQQTPLSKLTDNRSDGSESPATLKRSGARRRFPSPQKSSEESNQRKSKTWSAPPQPRSDFSEVASIEPDDSASMLFIRQERAKQQLKPGLQGLFEKPQANAQPPEPLKRDPTARATGSREPVLENISRRDFQDLQVSTTGPKRSSTRRRKLASHADLMSVLSNPLPGDLALASACSIRSSKSQNGQRTLTEVMQQLKLDEEKYMRELQTLIGGVIPVLLSKAMTMNQQVARNFGSIITTPIVDMGVVLERLRSIHKRMPLENSDALLFWAPQAHKVYADYINVWRLGYENVTINLSVSEDDGKLLTNEEARDHDQAPDVNSQIVDVTHLLKRPLVRVKNLARTLKSISLAKTLPLASDWASRYHDLVEAARQRQTAEKARLEDEAAASIDASRTRDPRTLAPLSGVRIDPKKFVKARDFFDLRLYHSSGQRIDCHVEMILREDLDQRLSGDILICEVDTMSRWLLLPPIKLSCVSARFGDGPGEAVVLLRSSEYSSSPWRELIALSTQDPQTASDWIELLGNDPVPPEVARASLPPAPPSLPSASSQTGHPHALVLASSSPKSPGAASEVEIPFGEQASVMSRRWESPTQSPIHSAISQRHQRGDARLTSFVESQSLDVPSSTTPPSLSQHPRPSAPSSLSAPSKFKTDQRPHSLQGSTATASHSSWQPESLVPEMTKAALRPVESPLRATRRGTDERPNDYNRMRRFANRETLSDVSSAHQSPSSTSSFLEDSKSRAYSVWMPQGSDLNHGDGTVPHTPTKARREQQAHSEPHKRDNRHRLGAAVVEMLTPSSLKDARRPAPAERSSTAFMAGGSNTLVNMDAGSGHRTAPRNSVLQGHDQALRQQPSIASSPVIASRPKSQGSAVVSPHDFKPPPASLFSARPASPLRHEYDPSTASEDEHVTYEDEDDAESISSASSAEDQVPSLLSASRWMPRRKAPNSVYVPNNPASLAPSQSASQAPYSTAPVEGSIQGDKKIALIFGWNDKGGWEQLLPDECSIVVSPGLIEAFEMSAAHSGQTKNQGENYPYFSLRPEGVSPLIGLELTPLVCLRRGTALDVSVRSPLTPTSTLKVESNQIMFRSRNNKECDFLYHAINLARINNPRYIAQQSAHPVQSQWSAMMDAREPEKTSRWPFGKRKSSYRAGSSRRTPSVTAQTQQSVGSAATASSFTAAIKRLATSSKFINVAKSTITHGTGAMSLSQSSATRSSLSGDADRVRSGSSTPPAGMGTGFDPAGGSPLGINEAKVRLYLRTKSGKFEDQGRARLTIMQPPRPYGAPPSLASDGRLLQEKRILVQDVKGDRAKLDVTLGEDAIVRVGRTGIGLNVLDRQDVVKTRGGVTALNYKVFMIHMSSEAQAAYTFSLLGRSQY